MAFSGRCSRSSYQRTRPIFHSSALVCCPQRKFKLITDLSGDLSLFTKRGAQFENYRAGQCFPHNAVSQSHSVHCLQANDQRNSRPFRCPSTFQRPPAPFPRRPIYGVPTTRRTRPSQSRRPRCATPSQAAPACGKPGHRRYHICGVNRPDAVGQAPSCYFHSCDHRCRQQQRPASCASVANAPAQQQRQFRHGRHQRRH